MAIKPISTYQNNDNSLLQIMQGGSGVITGIFDRAIQIGRDVSNKRTQQEQNLLGIRGQERALAQRGAQDLQQTIQDAQKFARGAYESDRSFAANRSDTAFNQNRQTANDSFTQGRALVNDGLSQSNSDRTFGLNEERMGMKRQEMEAEAASRKQLQDDTRTIYGGGPEVILPEGLGTFADTRVLPAKQGGDEQDPQIAIDANLKFDAAIRMASDPNATPQQRSSAEDYLNSANGGAGKTMTPAQQVAAERAAENQRQKDVKFRQGQEDRVADAAKTKPADIKGFLESNMSAFPNSQPALSAAVEAGTKVNDLAASDKDLYNASLNTAKVETNAVNTMEEEAYVNFKGGQVTYTDGVADTFTEGPGKGRFKFKPLEFTPREKDLRRKFYRMVKGGATAPAPTTPPASSPASRFLGIPR